MQHVIHWNGFPDRLQPLGRAGLVRSLCGDVRVEVEVKVKVEDVNTKRGCGVLPTHP